MLAHYVVSGICFLLDGVINFLFPAHFGFDSMYFVSSLGFCALMLSVRKMEFKDSIIIAILFGVFYGWGYAHAYFLYVVLFVLSALVTRVWSKRINESAIENIVLCIATLFVKEFMLYLYMRWSHLSAIDFNTWFVDRMFLTLLINGILVVILVFISYAKDDFLKRRDVQIRREEKLPWIH